MYRVIGSDGLTYAADDLATLQQWVNEGRVFPHTQIEDLATARRTTASELLGLSFAQFSAPPAQVAYPRAPVGEINPPIVKAALATGITFLFCCLPIGIVSIVYAVQAKSSASRGDLMLAEDQCKKAHMWANITIGISVALVLVYLVAFVIGVLGQNSFFVEPG